MELNQHLLAYLENLKEKLRLARERDASKKSETERMDLRKQRSGMG